MTAQQQRIAEAFRVRSYYGMGDLTQQGAAATVGSSLTSAGAAVGKVNPVAGAILAVGGAIADIVSLFGPNPNNRYATQVVNQVEADVLQPNLDAWQALPDSEKTIANQQAAEANFMNGWNYVLAACNNPQLGSAGINCIGDRQRGGKFDWFKLYYDPIANDPNVIPNPVASVANSVSGSVDSAVSSLSTSLGFSPLVIGLGLVALALVVSD